MNRTPNDRHNLGRGSTTRGNLRLMRNLGVGHDDALPNETALQHAQRICKAASARPKVELPLVMLGQGSSAREIRPDQLGRLIDVKA